MGKSGRRKVAEDGAVGIVVDFDGEVRQRWDGVDATRTQDDEAGLVPAAVLQQVNGPTEIVIEEFLGAGLAIHACKDAGIGSAIQNPVGGRKVGKILFVTDVPYPDINAQRAQWLEIGLAPLTDEAVDARDPNAGKMLEETPGDDRSGKAADAGDEYFHDFSATRDTRVTRE
jgi:hypothetical protein